MQALDLVAVNWTNAPTWILVALAVLAAWRITRGGGGAAVGELTRANEVLEKTLHREREAKEKLGEEVRDLRVELGEMRGRTDFAAALAHAFTPMVEWTQTHEQRANERHEAQLNILGLIAKRLGPEPNEEGGEP